MVLLEEITEAFKSLQDEICISLERLDGHGRFHEDKWQMETGGGGRTRVMSGRHIEKGGVNYSHVKGPVSAALSKILKKEGKQFDATGVSIVLHPHNPHVPIIHMNVRYFEMDQETWWFGGGIDLTPHYISEEQASNFHRGLKEVCDRFDARYYPDFKKWADDYFYLKHRDETRGVGGIFFDRLSVEEKIGKDKLFDFVVQVGKSFIPLYSQIYLANHQLPFSQAEQHWQYYRRGRYAEFNLVWDRGTRFGLETGGRTESILMSLPPKCIWVYDHQVDPESPEAFTLDRLKKDIDWISLGHPPSSD